MNHETLADGFGERLRTERQRLKLSQEELAHLIGLKKLTVYQYEKGNSSPTLQSIYALSKHGFRLQYLLFGRDQLNKLKDFPIDVIKMVTEVVAKIEKNFEGGHISDEAKLRMALIILDQYADTPEAPTVSDARAFEMLMGC